MVFKEYRMKFERVIEGEQTIDPKALGLRSRVNVNSCVNSQAAIRSRAFRLSCMRSIV